MHTIIFFCRVQDLQQEWCWQLFGLHAASLRAQLWLHAAPQLRPSILLHRHVHRQAEGHRQEA